MSTFEKIHKAALARLDAGEPLDIILQDYADYENELRPLLTQTTGKPIKNTAYSAPKTKNKNEQKSRSFIPMLVGAGAILLLFILFGAVVLIPTSEGIFNPEPDNIFVPASESNCIGIPQAQITSTFALENRNAQQTTNDSRSSTAETTSESELVYSSAPVADTSAGMSDVALAPPSVPLGTVATSSDMDMTAPVVREETESDDGVSADYYDSAEESASDSIAPPAPEVSRSTGNVSTEPLRAGEIDDNAEWDDYQDFRNDFLDENGSRSVRDVDTTGRQIIRVLDTEGNPVLNACVQIYHGESRITSSVTYATGMTMFFPNLNNNTRYIDTFRVIASKNGVTSEATLDRDVVGAVTVIELDVQQQNERVQLDVMFLLDATGSMGDEIAQLQGNILNISDQIDALPNNIDVRYGLVTYRDRGEQYVTRVHDFTDSVADFQDNLLRVEARGGGDYPESMNEGLDMALNAVEWREGDTVRLMFLVADAPPQVNYDNDADYSLLMQDALARGIKIHQIASGGLQPEGEFVMRQIGQFTMGRFLFLTYEDGTSGTAGDERTDLEVGDPEDEQGVGDYSVSQLDELVLRLITDEIEALQAE